MIQEYIAYLVKRLPKHFNQDVFAEMQHVLLTCPEAFKSVRKYRHLSRIISVHYLFRNTLLECVKNNRSQRYVNLKIFKENLYYPTGTKPILALLVGINFYHEKEILEQRHLFKAIRHLLPHVQLIENSFFSNRRGSEHVSTFYLEIEKS